MCSPNFLDRTTCPLHTAAIWMPPTRSQAVPPLPADVRKTKICWCTKYCEGGAYAKVAAQQETGLNFRHSTHVTRDVSSEFRSLH